MTPQQTETAKLVSSLYLNDKGDPFVLTPGQIEIFDCIVRRTHPRVRIMTPTRFGKSRTLSMALVTRCAIWPEKWAIVAPSNRKARIIMGYALEHVLQNPLTKKKLQFSKDEDLDRLRRERSKNRLTFKMADGKGVGDLFILSAEEHSVARKGEALIGSGSPNVVLDESSLIDDTVYATVKRMLGDAIDGDSCLIEVGNPFYKNHFYRIGQDENYHKIFIDWRQAVAEGRFTQSYIDEMKKEHLFDILYECKFPDDDAMDDEGWSALLTISRIEQAFAESKPYGYPRLGLDVAHGGNCWNAWVLRYDNIAFILRKDHDKNLMSVVGRTREFMDQYSVKAPHVFIDATGVGAGVADRLLEEKVNITPFVAGEQAEEKDRYINRRAEAAWRVKKWIEQGGLLAPDDDWLELSDIRWRVQSDRRIQIMPKELMARRGIASPDCFDALALTFASLDIDRPTSRMSNEARELMEYRREQMKAGNAIARI